MNLSFSTRGWQSFSFEENIETATLMGFGGIEIYNVQKCPELTDRGGAFHKYNTAATVRLLREKKLRIPCFDSSCDISEKDCINEAKELMNIARDAQTENVSVVALSNSFDNIYANLETLLADAEALKITILIKTSGVFSDTAKLRELLDRFASDNLAALWDPTHTYFDNNETADTTIKNLGAYVHHVHLRDSVDGQNYTLIGEGTLPVTEVMQALGSVDYDGFISAEWKPQWMEEIDDREIIFPYFVNYMNRFDSPAERRRPCTITRLTRVSSCGKRTSLLPKRFLRCLTVWSRNFPISTPSSTRPLIIRELTVNSATTLIILPARSFLWELNAAVRWRSGRLTSPRGI